MAQRKQSIDEILLSSLVRKDLLYAVFLVLGCLCIPGCLKTEEKIFLIEDGYQGRVVVFYNNLHGLDEEYEGEARVYRIPESGVLITKFNKDRGLGFFDWKVFYVNGNDERVEIPFLPDLSVRESGGLDSSQVYVYRAGYSQLILGPGQNGLENIPGYKGGDTVGYMGLMVSRPADWDSVAGTKLKLDAFRLKSSSGR